MQHTCVLGTIIQWYLYIQMGWLIIEVINCYDPDVSSCCCRSPTNRCSPSVTRASSTTRRCMSRASAPSVSSRRASTSTRDTGFLTTTSSYQSCYITSNTTLCSVEKCARSRRSGSTVTTWAVPRFYWRTLRIRMGRRRTMYHRYSLRWTREI